MKRRKTVRDEGGTAEKKEENPLGLQLIDSSNLRLRPRIKIPFSGRNRPIQQKWEHGRRLTATTAMKADPKRRRAFIFIDC
jgi:hypothetical protein